MDDYDDALVKAARGIDRAAEFDYQRWAPQLVQVYEAVTRGAGSPRTERAPAAVR